ncbi:P-loop containing nucleoside triphosphate hydrolase protein [Mycena maculata]|uniref:P-loop containing nucleoside triphosphate hydrolase protein n=1 Tax=Mycena maculata TaxID=230809 RepID=A0AAD7IQT5_9AGAR|nr:P-loop containing nucleoside triphosphate hydrolase protein [Mycena maculata]
MTESISAGKQVVLILVGLIGSGKSTFAQALETHFPEFRRCNQDDLGDRRQVEYVSREALRNGHSVCIDRTNFDPGQRAHWIKISREFPGTLIWVIVFDTPKDVCATRLRTRTGHPTITNPQDALSILDRFSSQYHAPSEDEGYDRIIYLQPAEQGLAYSHSSLAAILRRVRDAPSAVPPPSVGPAVSQHPTRGLPYSRGGSFRWTRGRGGGHYTGGGFGSGSSAATRGMNRWEAFSGQSQKPVAPPSPRQSESGFAPGAELVAAEHNGNSADPDGLPKV